MMFHKDAFVLSVPRLTDEQIEEAYRTVNSMPFVFFDEALPEPQITRHGLTNPGLVRRGKCPGCGSPNLHAIMTNAELAEERRNPTRMVLCRQCPDVWVLPIWDEDPPIVRIEHVEFGKAVIIER